VVHHIQIRIDEAPIEITISLLTPYIAYLAAERLQCSGVLATLACGLYLGRRSSGFYSLHARIEASAVWRTLDFALNGLVFLMLGLQLPYILKNIEGISTRSVILDGALFSLAVIVLRFLWVYPGEWIISRIRQWRGEKVRRVTQGEIFLVGWAGMRGVLSLAAAFSLPEKLSNGAPFPYRDLIIFLTFCVIFATLVVQGLSMPSLIRLLGLAGGSGGYEEETLARRKMISAALKTLDRIRNEKNGQPKELLDQFETYYRQRLALLEHRGDGASGDPQTEILAYRRHVAQELRNAERSVALDLRNRNKIHDEVLRRLEHELDLLDARFAESD
jgi:CPA1 family monovalent cation:H+ antiporter